LLVADQQPVTKKGTADIDTCISCCTTAGCPPQAGHPAEKEEAKK
jgi:hypothetical protein